MTRPFDGAISCLCEAAVPVAMRDSAETAARGGFLSSGTLCTKRMSRKALENVRVGLQPWPLRKRFRARATGAQAVALPRRALRERTPVPFAAIRHLMNRQERDDAAVGMAGVNVGRGPETRDA